MARTSNTLYACNVCGTAPNKSQKSSVPMAKDHLRAVRIYQQYGSRGHFRSEGTNEDFVPQIDDWKPRKSRENAVDTDIMQIEFRSIVGSCVEELPWFVHILNTTQCLLIDQHPTYHCCKTILSGKSDGSECSAVRSLQSGCASI